jgi:hypothetical protein
MSGEMSDQAPPVLAFLFSGAYEKEFTPFKKTSQLLSSSLDEQPVSPVRAKMY